MPKAYLVTTYRSISDTEKLAAYARLAAPAVQAAGGRFIARGPASAAYEHGLKERTVLVEFDDLATALRLYDSPAYRGALAALGDGAVRDMRVVEGV
jgi:uncharacterized protein (DUF1330 family)